jgi:hypothetical protein
VLMVVKGRSEAFEVVRGILQNGSWKYQLRRADGTFHGEGVWIVQHKLEYGDGMVHTSPSTEPISGISTSAMLSREPQIHAPPDAEHIQDQREVEFLARKAAQRADLLVPESLWEHSVDEAISSHPGLRQAPESNAADLAGPDLVRDTERVQVCGHTLCFSTCLATEGAELDLSRLSESQHALEVKIADQCGIRSFLSRQTGSPLATYIGELSMAPVIMAEAVRTIFTGLRSGFDLVSSEVGLGFSSGLIRMFRMDSRRSGIILTEAVDEDILALEGLVRSEPGLVEPQTIWALLNPVLTKLELGYAVDQNEAMRNEVQLADLHFIGCLLAVALVSYVASHCSNI